MRRLFPFLILLGLVALALAPQAARAQEASTPAPGLPSVGISSPAEGETLRGLVPVIATITLASFRSWELVFAYADNPTDTWFVLASGSQTVSEAVIFTWDTTSLADGDYVLRLRIFADDGYKDGMVFVRVANYTVYTPTPSRTPTATVTFPPTFTPLPSLTQAPTAGPTGTPLPPNPAVLSSGDILFSFGRGAGLMLLLFACFGGLFVLTRRFRS